MLNAKTCFSVLTVPVFILSGCATIERADELENRLVRSEDALKKTTAKADVLENRLVQLEEALKKTSAKTDAAMERALLSELRHDGKLAYQLALTDDKLMFPANSAELGAKDVAALDELAARLKAETANYAVEIQGHTDESGNSEFNYQLGQGRADAVRRYLYQRGGIPLRRMAIVSQGAQQPLAGKEESKEGNRRVEIRVYR